MFSDCTQPFRLSFYTDQLPDTVTAAIENLSLSRGEITPTFVWLPITDEFISNPEVLIFSSNFVLEGGAIAEWSKGGHYGQKHPKLRK